MIDNPLFRRTRVIKLGPQLAEPAEYRFNIPPRPKERARAGNGKHYTPESTWQYENAIAQHTKMQHPQPGPFIGKLSIEIHFFTDNFRCDVDNLVKSILDGMQQRKDRKTKQVAFVGAFKDDNQIDQIFARRWYEPKEALQRTEVIIRAARDKQVFTEEAYTQWR